MADKSKKPPGQFTHWARPRWLRMYEYNYEYGESYYRNQVRYVSTSSVASDTSSYIDSRRAYLARRSGAPPPRAKSFIERWAADPFYGRGFASSASAAERSSRSASRAVSASSNYASNSLLSQIRSARASTSSVLEESQSVQQELRSRRARSVEARSSAVSASYGYGSDDCLMRASALDASAAAAATVAQQRAIRAQSTAAVSTAELNYSRQSQVRASSVARSSTVQQSSSVARSSSVDKSSSQERALSQKYADESFNYAYPVWSSFACNNTCATKKGVEDRRFVMGNKYVDAAALGGFDVLYDPSSYSKTRTLLKRLSEERDIVSEYRAESVARTTKRETESQSRQSSSRLAYKYNTIY